MVDDEEQVLISFDTELRSGGLNNLASCSDSREVISVLEKIHPAAVLLDLWMPHVSGEELLEKITVDYPEIPIIVVTGLDQVETAVRCIKAGAFDFLAKPVEGGLLTATVNRALKFYELNSEVDSLRRSLAGQALANPGIFAEIVTENEEMLALFRYVEAIATGSQPVMIVGETGVGKELFARAVHQAGRRPGPFVSVNAAGLDDNVFADTLFGHSKGAYTGAQDTRTGLVEKTQSGTLFLDEIGDLSQTSQLKLLRLAQEREYLPLGVDQVKTTEARLVVATNQDIEALVSSGRFRKDLYYRLRTHQIRIPPLRNRLEDLPALIDRFLTDGARDFSKKKPTPPPELFTLLAGYHFPGNVRELKAMVYDAVSRHQGKVLSLEAFKEHIRPGENRNHKSPEQCLEDAMSLFAACGRLPTLAQAGELLVTEALRRAGGNITQAAGLLGVTRQALSKRLRRGDD
jgi:DNA-binding NtrC family response regulator